MVFCRGGSVYPPAENNLCNQRNLRLIRLRVDISIDTLLYIRHYPAFRTKKSKGHSITEMPLAIESLYELYETLLLLHESVRINP